jgi:hypothetical protein
VIRLCWLSATVDLFIIKSTEGFCAAGFHTGMQARALAEKATAIHPLLQGYGCLLQPFSASLRQCEYRIFLKPFTGRIDAILATRFEEDYQEMNINNLTEGIDQPIIGDPPETQKLVSFIELLVRECKEVQKHLQEGWCTRIDCFVDSSTGAVLLNEITTGLDVALFLAFRARCLSRYADWLFWQLART